jgi:O-antigen ligase
MQDNRFSTINVYSSYLTILCFTWLVAFSVPNLFFLIGNEYDNKRVITILGLCLANTILIINRKLNFELILTLSSLSRKILFSLILFVIILFANSFRDSAFVWDSLFEASVVVLLIITTLNVCSILNTVSNYKHLILKTIAVGCFLYSFLITLNLVFILLDLIIFNKEFVPDNGYSLTYVNFANVRFMNQIQSWVFPIIIFLSFSHHSYGKLLRIISIYSYLVFSYLIIASQSRSVFVELIVFIGLCVFIRSKASLKVIKYILISVVIGAVLQFLIEGVVYNDVKSMLELKMSSSGRVFIWLSAIEQATNNLLLGQGLGAFMDFSLQQTAFKFPRHPHNIFVQYFYEFGVFGAFLIALIMSYSVYFMFNKIKEKNCTELRLYMFLSVIGGLVHSMFSGIFVMPLSQLTGAIVLGFSMHLFMHTEKEHKKINAPKTYTVFIPIVLLCSFTQVGLAIFSHAKNISTIEKNYIDICKQDTMYPRMWFIGESKLYTQEYFQPDIVCPNRG